MCYNNIEQKGGRKVAKKKHVNTDIIRYTPNYNEGLNEEQIKERNLNGLVNISNDVNKKGYFGIIIRNLFTFFNIVYIFIAVLLIIVNANISQFTFLLLVTLNTLIGTIQEIRSRQTIDKLKLLSTPTVTVVRQGQKVEVGVSEVVLDDIMYLTPGREITTDAILVNGEVEVNESQLTGESIPIRKNVGATLYSGSFVVSGNCLAQVERVGNDNEIAKLAAQAKKYKQPQSGILSDLNKMLKVVSVILVVFGALLFFRGMEFKFDLHDPEFTTKLVDSILKTTTALIGMIPQGLYLMTTIALAMGVIRLAKRNTLVQDIYCIEMLARVDVLCLDKTGTITDGTMSVVRYVEYQKGVQFNIKEIIASMNSALHETNMTAKALETYFGFSEKMKPLEVLPFASERKYSAVTFEQGTFLLGAPEFVLRSGYEKYAETINEFANQGFRILALGYCSAPLKDGKVQKAVKLISLIIIEDQIRPEVFDTIKYFKDNGVEVKVISGDNPVTVAEVARRVGIKNSDEYISLEGLSDDEVYEAANKYTVFGRVKPNQKQIIVKSLKDHKHTVAMTGDGVNDILALKEADCSIAMASGNDAVKSVAKLVLLDSNFSSLPQVVGEGRRVINNIQQTSMLFLVKTLFIIILAFLTIVGFINKFHPDGLAGFPIMYNTDLLLLEFLGIGIPSFFLAIQPNNRQIQGNFLVNAIKKALPGALAIIIEVVIAYVAAKPLGLNSAELNTVVVLCATYTEFMVLYIACQPFSFKKSVMFVGCVSVALLLTVLAMMDVSIFGIKISEQFFHFVALYSIKDGHAIANPLLLLIILSLLSYTLITSITHFISEIEKAINNRKERFKIKKEPIDRF